MAYVTLQSVGGWDATVFTALDDSPGILIKASQGILHGWAVLNTTAAVAYIQIFDAAALADVVLGTTVAKLVIPLAANGVSNITGVDFCATAGIAIFSTTTTTGSTAAATSGTIFWA